jgi:predicted regulator of Ras-like GTPase activity (Roadblock/LC7/MglB family)
VPKVPTAAPAANIPKPSVPAPSLPKPPVPQPPKPAPIAAPSSPVQVTITKEATTLGELFGDPEKKDWSPREIVQKINTLKGISGSLVVLLDGLMVAGELPAPFRAETTAAFLPQIFGRMNQYAKELNLGEMNTVTVECDKAPLQITKAGPVFLGVIGKPGGALPTGQIKLIATELAKQNK